MRVAAGPGIGLGHISRCRALSRYLQNPFFVTAFEGVSILLKMGIRADRVIPISPSDQPNSWLERIDKSSVIIFDSLASGQRLFVEQEVIAAKSLGRSVVVIDSMPPDHFIGSDEQVNQCDIVITPYLGAERLRPTPLALEWLAGAEWSILPAELLDSRCRPFPTERRILLTCGGSDPEGLSLRVAQILGTGQTNVDVIIGPDFSSALIADLYALAKKSSVLHLVRDVNNMLAYYLRSTLVVGRPGLQRYEAAALGRRAIYFWHGSRFLKYFENFASEGLAEFYFDADPLGWEAFETRLVELRDEVKLERICQMNKVGMEKVDGAGVKKVAQKIYNLGCARIWA